MSRRWLTATAAVALLVPFAVNAQLRVLGPGNKLCSDWTIEDRDPDSLAYGGMVVWVLGFLSGAAASHSIDLLRTTDLNDVQQRVGVWCEKHPRDHVMAAAESIALDLAKAVPLPR